MTEVARATTDSGVSISGHTIVELVGESGAWVTYRGVADDGVHVTIKTARAQYPRVRDLAELRREFDVLSRLSMPGIVTARALLPHGSGNLALVTESFGKPLAQLLNERAREPLPLETFFPLVIRLTRILGALHERHVVHKDVTPRSIHVDPISWEPRLANFGLCSELTLERQSAKLSTKLEGSLPYISPEQTGRTSRDVDWRSDYYSLGVTCFELLTGSLPFDARDALEWAHRHISQPPPLASHRRAEVPDALARVIEKLMAKSAEQRYQSTLRADRGPRALPRRVGGRGRGGRVRARRRRRVAPLPDPAAALRPRARGRASRRAVRPCGARRDDVRAGLGVLRRRQVRAGRRDGPRDRAAPRLSRRGEVRSVPAGHRVRRDRRRVPCARGPAARRAGRAPRCLARRAAAGARRQRGARHRARARAGDGDRRDASGARAAPRRSADAVPAHLREPGEGVRDGGASARAVHGRPAVERRAHAQPVGAARHGARRGTPAHHRRVPRQRRGRDASAHGHARPAAQGARAGRAAAATARGTRRGPARGRHAAHRARARRAAQPRGVREGTGQSILRARAPRARCTRTAPSSSIPMPDGGGGTRSPSRRRGSARTSWTSSSARCAGCRRRHRRCCSSPRASAAPSTSARWR